MHGESYGEIDGRICRTRKVRPGVPLHATHIWMPIFSEASATERGQCASCPSKMGQGGGGGWGRERNPDLSGENIYVGLCGRKWCMWVKQGCLYYLAGRKRVRIEFMTLLRKYSIVWKACASSFRRYGDHENDDILHRGGYNDKKQIMVDIC